MLLSGRKRKRKSGVRFVFLWWTIHVCLCYIWCLASSRCDFRTDIISPNSTSKINRKQNIDYIFEMISLLFKIDFNDKETSALSRIYLGRSKTWFTDAMWILELTSDGSSCLRFLWLAVSLNSLSRDVCLSYCLIKTALLTTIWLQFYYFLCSQYRKFWKGLIFNSGVLNLPAFVTLFWAFMYKYVPNPLYHKEIHADIMAYMTGSVSSAVVPVQPL